MIKKKGSSTSKRVHIISRNDGWAVKREGASRASRIYETKKTAVNSVTILRSTGHDVVVHKKDGSIQKWIKSKK